MNYKIAVCDDERTVCKTIFCMIDEIAKQMGIRLETDCFTSGEELCQEMEDTAYDLIFLDIELPKMNGIEVGKYIRETLNNETVQIAYISSKQQYAMGLFEIRPINFLIKPITADNLEHIIQKFLKLHALDTQLFTFKVKKEHFKVPLSEIMYLEGNGRTVTLVSIHQRHTFYGSLENIYSELKYRKFLYIHKSFIVNYRYVQQYEYEQVTLTDGTALPISQPRRKIIRRMILEMES